MPAHPLNQAGGTAVLVAARVSDEDVARLAVLVARRGVRQATVVRELLRAGLDQLERENGPPRGG
jgi:hypothetical protein